MLHWGKLGDTTCYITSVGMSVKAKINSKTGAGRTHFTGMCKICCSRNHVMLRTCIQQVHLNKCYVYVISFKCVYMWMCINIY